MEPLYALVLVGYGDPDEHAAILDRVRAAVPPLFELVTPIPFTQLQSKFDAGAAAGNSCYERAVYLPELTDEAIAVISAEVPRKSSPLAQVVMYTLGEAYSAVDHSDTAFGGPRTARYAMYVVGLEPGQSDLTASRAWVRRFTDAVGPATVGGGYVNGVSEPAKADLRRLYGPDKHERLRGIKAVYDPTNVFHHNVNIIPK